MSSNSSLDDLNNHVLIGDCSNNVKSLLVDTDHLYRHLTEVNGRDTRVRVHEINQEHGEYNASYQGGYIEGQLEFQESLLASSFALKISLVSAGADKRVSGIAGPGVAAKRLHPNLLYLTRFDGTKRQRELEARAPMWKIDLEITGKQRIKLLCFAFNNCHCQMGLFTGGQSLSLSQSTDSRFVSSR